MSSRAGEDTQIKLGWEIDYNHDLYSVIEDAWALAPDSECWFHQFSVRTYSIDANLP